jgi:hypothetical protein
LTISIASVRSVSFWHLLLRILQSFSLLTVSYAFYRSIRAAYFLLFFPYPGWIWVISLQMCAEVEVPSLNPVWYILVYSKWGASAATLAMMAFSMILAT